MASLKISMACWQLASIDSTREKVAAARAAGVPTVTGGGPFEIAVALGHLDDYLALCADIGVERIEAGCGFTDMNLPPVEVVKRARAAGLETQFELGKKHGGGFTDDTLEELVVQGHRWLDAGACHLVIEARESAVGVGLFDASGELNRPAADAFAAAFGLDAIIYEAPTKASQFAFMKHLGERVQLSNVRLEEVLRVEIYRRGLHSDAFDPTRFARPQTTTADPGARGIGEESKQA